MTDPRRTAIVDAARSQVGPGNVPAYWASSGLPADTHRAWCGAFALYCLHEAGVALGVKWIFGIGFVGPQHLALTRNPQPGDIVYKDQPWQHYGVVASFENGVLKTIEGNTPTVAEKTHTDLTGLAFYSIDKFLKVATPPEVATSPLTAAPDPGSPGGEAKSRDTRTANTGDALLLGIDVSHHQQPAALNYTALAKTHRFVICRATYGTRTDETFAEHVHRAQDVGLTVGAYHFYRPGEAVVDQLDAFLSVAHALGVGAGWLPPAIDLEQDPGHVVSTDAYAPAEQLTACFREQFGAAMVYVAIGFWSEIGHPEWVKDHLLWTAHWDVQHPTTPGGAPWAIWQNHVGQLPGISPGPVDQDVARSLPILKSHDPAAPLLVAVDWDELRADRDAVVQGET